MNWRLFFKANKAMLLSLPGAALWSMPVGAIAWEWMRIHAAVPPPTDFILTVRIAFVYLMTPVTAVCSFAAMEIFSESRTNHGVAALMLFFNQITVVIASVGTIAVVLDLFGRLLKWIS